MNWLLDTNSIIYIQKGLVKESIPDVDVFISVITRMELLSFPNLEEPSKIYLHQFLESCSVIPLNQEVEDKAIEIRSKYNGKIKIPDAIIIASAIHTNSILISNDKQLEQVKEIQLKRLMLA